jgi:signal transduction histidine kinase
VANRTRELARANKELRRLSQRILDVQESERRLIARELHDEIGQALTGVKMMLETFEKEAGYNGERSAAKSDAATQRASRLGDVRDVVSDALEQVRDLSMDLRPAILDSLGLLPVLIWQFDRYTRQTAIHVTFQHAGLEQRLPLEIETGVYRLIQEALTNIARHADVRDVAIQVRVHEETLTLFVVDAGSGFDAERALEEGSSTGLASMRERADLLGGTLRITSELGEGTTVEAELPLRETLMFSDASLSQSLAKQQLAERAAARNRIRDRQRDAHGDAARESARDSLRDASRDRDAACNASRDREHDTAYERQQTDRADPPEPVTAKEPEQ